MLFIRCGEYRVSEIKIQEVAPDQVVVEDDTPVVWQIALDPPRAMNSVTVGTTPSGAREVVALRSPLRSGTYHVTIRFADDRRMSLDLRPAELKEGSIGYLGKTYSPEEFERLATDCPPG